jgi:hypothetical protein
MSDLWCFWVLRIDCPDAFPNTPHSLQERYYHFSVCSLVINSGESWKKTWVDFMFHKQPQQWGRVETGQGSRTSKGAGKGADGRMIFVLASGRVCCWDVWSTRLSASIPGSFPRPEQETSTESIGTYCKNVLRTLGLPLRSWLPKTGHLDGTPAHLYCRGTGSHGSR